MNKWFCLHSIFDQIPNIFGFSNVAINLCLYCRMHLPEFISVTVKLFYSSVLPREFQAHFLTSKTVKNAASETFPSLLLFLLNLLGDWNRRPLSQTHSAVQVPRELQIKIPNLGTTGVHLNPAFRAACQIYAINCYMTQINSETDIFSNQIAF